jgi:hypothetical protein
MRVLFVTTIFVAATPIAIGAASQVTQFPKDQPYAKARKLLVKKGWKPVHEGVVIDVYTVGETEPVVTEVQCKSGCS